MPHFFIASQNDFDRIAVITAFEQEFHRIEKNGDTALHIQNTRAGDFAVFDGKRTSRRCTIRKDGIHMPCQDDEGLTHVAVLCDKHISCLLIGMKTHRKAKCFKEMPDVLPYCIDSCLIGRAAVTIDQHAPCPPHGFFIFIHLGE